MFKQVRSEGEQTRGNLLPWELLAIIWAGTGTGGMLGIWRALTAGLVHYPWVEVAGMNLVYGWGLGAGLVAGMCAVARLVSASPTSPKRQYLAAWLSFLAGGLAFGLVGGMFFFAMPGFTLSGQWMELVATFEAGLSLALALWPFPFQGRRIDLPPRSWPWRMLIAGAFFVSLHGGFLLLHITNQSALVIWPGAVYQQGLEAWGGGALSPDVFNRAALLDAFVSGALLCLGLLAGLRLAASNRQWVSRRSRSGLSLG